MASKSKTETGGGLVKNKNRQTPETGKPAVDRRIQNVPVLEEPKQTAIKREPVLCLNPGVLMHPSPIVGPLLFRAQQLEASGIKVLKGNIGDAAVFYPPSQAVIEETIRMMREKNSDIRPGYGDSRGLPQLRQMIAIAEMEDADAGYVIIGNGGSEIMQMLATGFAGKDANILLPSPCFSPYLAWIDFMNASGVSLEPRMYAHDIGKGWNIDMRHMLKQIDDNTRAVLVINPSNPTGWVGGESELSDFAKKIGRINGRRKRDGIPPLTVISDEVYRDIVFDGKAARMVDVLDVEQTNLIVIGSASKAARLSGERVGYAAVMGPDKGELYEMLFNQACNRLAPNSKGQLYYLNSLALGHPGLDEMRSDMAANAELAHQELSKSPKIRSVKPSAGFYIFVRVENDGRWADAEDFCARLLEEKHVLVSSGTEFIGPTDYFANDGIFFRLVYLSPPKQLLEMCSRIVDFVENR